MNPKPLRVLLNGAEPSAADLHGLVLTNYGHFTSFQHGNGGVAGLGLHLQRLNQSTQALFGQPLPGERVRAELKTALTGLDAAMVRINVFSRGLNLRQLETDAAPDLLITVLPPREGAAMPLRVRSVQHGRYLPQVKHVGTFNLFHQRRLARQAGYDDVLFADERGEISEGSIWNVGFWDGNTLTWPSAPALPGVSMQLLSASLKQQGVPVQSAPVNLKDLPKYRCAFFSNAAMAVQPVANVDETKFGADEAFYRMLKEAWARVPREPI